MQVIVLKPRWEVSLEQLFVGNDLDFFS
ncbi:uncharacterized protein METZ01_LOCUS344861 [marine metagenome]|uniref:Uncharacterized protein n=1 Tax=marine metagenome TaxID=408172 RepID=A0A382R472_9ZZZZ